MDRHGSSYRNNFSQASSSAAPSIRSSAAGHDDEDYGIFSQETSYPLTAPSLSTPRVALQNLDLNSYANNFPHIASYSELLESDVPRLPPLPPRSGHGPVQPPRQGAGGRGPGRGGPGRGAQGRRSYSNTRGAAGRGTLMPNRLGHGSSSAGNFFPPQDLDAHNQWEQADDNSSQLNHFDKARWIDERNTHIFCELCVEQIREGNCPNGKMKTTAYRTIAQKFLERTSLNHEVKQFRNRWTQCKAMWEWYDWSQGETGLGRSEDGTIIADDNWWITNTQKKYSECKKFRNGIPTYIDHLAEMFQGNTVDGRSSCIPGGNSSPANTYEEEDDDEDAEEDRGTRDSPMSTSNQKRGSSTIDSFSSPAKRSKSPMIKAMRGLTEAIQFGNNTEFNTLKELQEQKKEEKKLEKEEKRKEEEQVEQDIDHCMSLVKGCGLTEDTEEFYVATRLFAQKYERTIFKKLTTNGGRLAWLKRCCRDWSG